MDPEIAIFSYLIIFTIIYYVAYFISKINFWSSIVLALVISAIAISVLCPVSTFDKTEENHNSANAFFIIYGITLIVVLLYIFYVIFHDTRCC